MRAGFRGKDEAPLKKEIRPRQTLRPGERAWDMGHGEHEYDFHDMEGEIQIGDTFRKPKFRKGNRLQTFDRVVANPMWNQTEFKEKDYDADELDRFPKGAGYPGSKADWGWMQHILASLKPEGRAAVVLDTGAASRGSGNANTNKEKDVRRWFVEQDLIEGVIYLPENLFYNTTAPGIVIVLNKAKPKAQQGKIFLLNASREFVKGDPKNYIPEDAIVNIADTFISWSEDIVGAVGNRPLGRIVTREEIAKNDFNISPSRYIHTGEADEYRPLAEIVEELNALEEEAKATDAALKAILKRIGV
jgi:type I restriction enzyme M protein